MPIEVDIPFRYLKFTALIIIMAGTIISGVLMTQSSDNNSSRQNSFEEVTHRISDNPSMRRYGAATVQIKDEQMVFITGYGGPNSLMKWRGDRLVSDTPERLRDPNSNAIGAAACDIDGDGEEEIYVLTTGESFGGKKTTSDKLYDKQDGKWVDLMKNSSVGNGYSGRSVACTFTPNGYGFFVARYGGPMQLIIHQKKGLDDIASDYNMDKITGGRSIVNLPHAQGVDLFVGNERGPNFYFRSNGEYYREVAGELGIQDKGYPARGVTIYDMDSDGDFDLAISNWNSENRIYENTGSGFRDVTSDEFSVPGPARSLVSADFDNSGSTDIFLNNIASRVKAPNKFFTSDGEELPVGEAAEPEGLGTGATVADIDLDGTLELILTHGESGAQPVTMYKIPNEGESMRVQPVWKSGAPARTSFVKLEGEGKVYPVDGGSGYLNQMEPWAHLGGVQPPVDVKVFFPDGTTKTQEITESNTKVFHPDYQ